MEIKEILSELRFLKKGVFPREALAAAMDRREEIVPELLKILEDFTARAPKIIKEEKKAGVQYMSHIFAMYLLAYFREPRAYPAIVKFFSLPGEIALELTGDVVSEDLGRILASVCPGDTRLLQAMIENRKVNEWVRGAALESWLEMIVAGRKSREEVVEYYRSLFHGKLERKPSHAWDMLAWNCADLRAAELREEIRKSYEEGLVDPAFIDWEEVEEELEKSPAHVLSDLKEKYLGVMEDPITELESWSSFSTEEEDEFDQYMEDYLEGLEEEEESSEQGLGGGTQDTYRREEPKISRNAPCPCGSGKKYKKCCGK